jgi:hypothetical protein
MKGVRSKEKLACKGTLFNVAFNKEITRVRALPIVLETNPMNIIFVVQRQRNKKIVFLLTMGTYNSRGNEVM